ncbi:acyltransferase-like protein [Paraburkholderia sp. BL6669N2]|uniref:acyltransferase family protein n=1 Tax=Paraburkholderia sp. BL6669N2 TaxID=1938807 RepID=UPI000E226C75|nr:acyltransferase [Paraburkholderia sp. BL6669N2]REG61148.1 acyltransferase-like protein [Paraburkholderia sp. BL6669N2]
MVKNERIRGCLAISIIAIVCAEVIGRLGDAGFLQDGHVSSVLKILRYAANALGYPTAFFLLGMSTVGYLQRSRADLLKYIAVGVLYPYLLWSILQMAFEWLVADYKDYAGQQFELTRLALVPGGQFWFLYALFICQIVACITVWPRSTKVRSALTVPNRCLLVAMFIVCAAIATRSRWGIVTMTCWGLVFFLPGVLLGSRPDRQGGHAAGVHLAWVTTIAFAVVAFMGQRAGHDLDLYSLLASFLGIVAAISIGRCLPIWRRSRWIVSLGSAWKPVYLLHVLATAVVWNALLAFHISQPVVHFVLGSATGLALPIAIWLTTKRLGIAHWVGFEEPIEVRNEGTASASAVAHSPEKTVKSGT